MEYQMIVSLPPGYRFCPTDEELVIHYLHKKVKNLPISNFTVKECDLYGATEPWEIWKSFGGDKRVSDQIDKDEGLFFFTRLKKRGPKDSRFSRSVGSGIWHEDSAAGILSRDGKKLPIGRKRKFIYKNKKSGHNGRWSMHEISLLDQSIDLVLCLLRKNDNRKFSEFGTDQQEAISNDNGTSVRKRQRLISGKSQEGEPTVLNNSETLITCEAEAISDCDDISLEQAVLAVPALADDSGELVDEIMELLNEEESPTDETDTSAAAAMETNSIHPTADGEVLVSENNCNTVGNWKTPPDLTDDSDFVDEIMELPNKEEIPTDETDTSAVPVVKSNSLHPVEDSEVIKSNMLPPTTEQSQPVLSSESLSFFYSSKFSSVDEVLEYFDCEKSPESAVEDHLVPTEEQAPEISLTSQASALAFEMSSNYVEVAEEQSDSESISSHKTTTKLPFRSCSPRVLSETSLPVGNCDTDADDYSIDWTQHFADYPEYEPPYLLE